MKINRNKWQTAFEKELDKAEKRQLSKVKRFYKSEYNKGVVSFLAEGQTNFQLLFDNKDLLNIYRDLYSDIGLQFAKWYAKNYDKYLSKGVNPSEYVGEWTNKFASFGSAVGAQRVTLVSGTAKQTLIKVTQNLMRDPEFMTLGNTEKGRILKSQFNRYSQYQSERLVRTEATNAANFATMESATTIFPGAQMKKEWIASFDDRTRSTHSEAGASEPIPYNEPFMVGGSLMMYPGDPSGPASEVVNCRCSVAPFPVKGAQAVNEITDINFGLGGANTTGVGLSDFASVISPTVAGETVINASNTKTAKTLNEAIINEKEFLKTITKKEYNSLTEYTNSTYIELNGFLRGRKGFSELGNDKSFMNLLNTLDKTLEKSPKFETLTHRFISFEDRGKFKSFISNIKTNGTFTERGFMSTSTEDLSRFMDGKYRVKIEIEGKNGRLLKESSINPDENEVLFRKGTSFNIESFKKMYDDEWEDNAEYILKLKEI